MPRAGPSVQKRAAPPRLRSGMVRFQSGFYAASNRVTGTSSTRTMKETDILQAELERLFELDELLQLSRDVLGFEPENVGGTGAKASFAGALTAHCAENEAI